MVVLYRVTAFISAVAVLLVHATPQNTAASTSIASATTSIAGSISSTTTSSAADSTVTSGGLQICPVTEAPFPLKFLTCATSETTPTFDSCTCDANGLAYKFFFSCAFQYVQERTANATTDQTKQDIKSQVQSVINQYVVGCKGVGMPITALDVTSGTPPPFTGGFTFSTEIVASLTASLTSAPLTSASLTGASSTGASPTGASPTGAKTGGASLAPYVCNNGVGFAPVLAFFMLAIN